MHEIPLWEALGPVYADGEGDYPRIIVSGP